MQPSLGRKAYVFVTRALNETALVPEVIGIFREEEGATFIYHDHLFIPDAKAAEAMSLQKELSC